MTHSLDSVINGHNHTYGRPDPIKGGAATTRAPIGSAPPFTRPSTAPPTSQPAAPDPKPYELSASDSYEGSVDDESTVKPGCTVS